ncbi:centrosomal protein of 68 kDa isoform X2 [Centropristis striata]|uniref:centrosomal protein of 68 kDa isoform X2 n=1 Tax=Centropristis striata TaxID=184440 RepID=UPI0027E1DA6F|nr:centrosomal protein of 68 kDa isoform X2 [Centropristis striata]
MEAKRSTQRWKRHIPEYKHSRRDLSPSPEDNERDRAGPQKSVTMAPTCRYLSDRQYAVRKPLLSGDRHASILKKLTNQEKPLGVSRREEEDQQHADMDVLTRPKEELTPVSFRHSASPPLRPQLISTVLHPTYTPHSGHSRLGKTKLSLGRREGSPEGHSKEHALSPFQVNYWACAIPKALAPSPDRHSAGWDPDKEYQALLDYTYPLRPGQEVCEGDSSKNQGAPSLLQTESNLQDSGIELDHLCSSTSLSMLDFSLSRSHMLPDLQGLTKSSHEPPSRTFLSSTDLAGLSLDSLSHSKIRGGLNHHHQVPSSPTSSAFSRFTSAFPHPRSGCVEVDEEFLALPEQLEELQMLSRQVREVTDKLRQPVTSSWESLELGTTSILSSTTLPDKQEAQDNNEKEVSQDEGKDETGREERSAAHTADPRDFEAVSRSWGAWPEPGGVGLRPSSLREVEALAQQLCGLTLPGSRRSSWEAQEQSDSLIKHIQVFCSHLEQLIQQLYTLSEKVELLAAPTVNIDSVKSSLADYQSFQREVRSHQPLTSCVLHTGQLLLSCINTMSPFLRDTLLLIERQCGALESHTENLFSCILSAMDSLTQPGQSIPVQQSKEDPGPVRVQGSTL